MVIQMYGGYAVMKKEHYYTLYVKSVYKSKITYSLDYTHAKMYKSKKQANVVDRKIECGVLK